MPRDVDYSFKLPEGYIRDGVSIMPNVTYEIIRYYTADGKYEDYFKPKAYTIVLPYAKYLKNENN